MARRREHLYAAAELLHEAEGRLLRVPEVLALFLEILELLLRRHPKSLLFARVRYIKSKGLSGFLRLPVFRVSCCNLLLSVVSYPFRGRQNETVKQGVERGVVFDFLSEASEEQTERNRKEKPDTEPEKQKAKGKKAKTHKYTALKVRSYEAHPPGCFQGTAAPLTCPAPGTCPPRPRASPGT